MATKTKAAPQQSYSTENRVAFGDRDVRELEPLLARVAAVSDITWEFTDDCLAITGLGDGEVVEIGHRRSAKAFLDAYLIGYNHGYGDGKDATV